ncbi:hypothetical protein AB4853_40010 [Bradyrhizobium sp. 1050_B9_N1_2]|uniref:hypothetical protein n=1 Tax=Bradyrhizobium sp. 1050_B9_N1_2 TaxID=3238688 RepID=UPI003EDB879A
MLADFVSSSEKLCQFAIQLLLDPATGAVNFVKSLPFRDCDVQINMLVVDLQGGDRVACDLVSERPDWDIDDEGLLRLALQHHGIRLVEIDYADIDAEPRASNCAFIWSHRDHPVPVSIEKAINRALTAHQGLTIRSLSTLIGLRDPKPEISALVCQGVVMTDLSVKFGPNAIIHKTSDPCRARNLLRRTSNRFGKTVS